MDRILSYLQTTTPTGIVDRKTGAAITDMTHPNIDAIPAKGDYRLATHEWGLTYSGMMLAAETTGDAAFMKYVTERLSFLAAAVPYFENQHKSFPKEPASFEAMYDPQSLDDSGSMCAAMIKASQRGVTGLDRIINNHLDFIMNRSHRLGDGTFARNRPYPNTVWADDLYQSIPALAQAGRKSGDRRYFDEAARQVLLYAGKVFNKSKGIYFHGSVEGMDPHPEFYWARVNGWVMMAMLELLEVLPADHPKRGELVDLFNAHVAGVVGLQSGAGLWHQLLDRPDAYLETSASAMFTFCIAHAVTRKWISAEVYGPVALVAWTALTTKVNDKGQVEGTSAGTSMAFDPAFYYNRPVSAMGPHGYGSVLLAGAAMHKLLTEWQPVGTPVIFKK